MAPAGKSLRVLFVGALGQRKGLSYLLSAAAQVSTAIELTLLGRKTAEDCEPLDEAVRTHRWIPSCPHSEVLAEMGRDDITRRIYQSWMKFRASVVPWSDISERAFMNARALKYPF